MLECWPAFQISPPLVTGGMSRRGCPAPFCAQTINGKKQIVGGKAMADAELSL